MNSDEWFRAPTRWVAHAPYRRPGSKVDRVLASRVVRQWRMAAVCAVAGLAWYEALTKLL